MHTRSRFLAVFVRACQESVCGPRWVGVDVCPSPLPAARPFGWVEARAAFRRARPICGSDCRGVASSALIVRASVRSTANASEPFTSLRAEGVLNLICYAN